MSICGCVVLVLTIKTLKLKASVYRVDDPGENSLITESSLHSRGISIYLKGSVGGKSCSKTPGSIPVNKSCWIQPGASFWYILISVTSAHLHPSTRPLCHLQNVLACHRQRYYSNLGAFIVLVGLQQSDRYQSVVCDMNGAVLWPLSQLQGELTQHTHTLWNTDTYVSMHMFCLYWCQKSKTYFPLISDEI